jgi:hypothetical protein
MTKCLRLAWMSAAVLLVALAAALLRPEWGRDLGVEGLALPAPDGGGRLPPDGRVRAVDRRIEQKDRLAGEVVAGRLTLFEAAARFRRLNDEPPAPTPLSASFPGDSEEERLCRQVIDFARSWLRQQPGGDREADEFAARCEDELRRHKERHGAVVLPAVTDRACPPPPPR